MKLFRALLLGRSVPPPGILDASAAILLLAVLLGVAPAASATTLSVDATDNIYGAGLSSPPNPGGGGAGNLPPGVALQAAANQVLTFSSVTGTSTLTTSFGMFPPDGNANFPMNMSSYGGISGIISSASSFLVGVFLDPAAVTAPPPATLNFTAMGLGTNFTTLSPLLGQMFYVGDGLTGSASGSVQQFHVPAGATLLYLGFPDGSNYTGLPGQYQDNAGTLTATFTIGAVPEPGTVALLIGAGCLSLACRRRRPGRLIESRNPPPGFFDQRGRLLRLPQRSFVERARHRRHVSQGRSVAFFPSLALPLAQAR